MSTRNLLNLALLILVLVLISFVIFEPGKDKPITLPTLTKLKANDIQDITIKRRGDKSNLIFNKTAQGWMMLKPYRQSANGFRLDSILKLLSATSYSQNSLMNLDPDKFGLKQPLATITFNKTAIEFGNNNSLKHHRYVKIDSTLHMIPDTFYYQLAAKAASFINHKLITENIKITELTLPALKLVQHNGKWELSPRNSKSDKVSADSINKLIDEWQLSQAHDIKITKSTPKSKANIIINLSDGTTLRFKSNAHKDNFTLTNIDSGVRYILSSDRKDKLLKLSPIEKDD